MNNQQTTRSNKHKRTSKKQNKSLKKVIKRVVLISILLGLIFLVAGTILFAYYASNAPAFSEEKLKDPMPARVFDQNDQLVTTIYEGHKRELLDIDNIPKHVKDAVLATEDNRFYNHGALDFRRTAVAVLNNVTGGFGSQGGSTITQQVVKRVFLTEEKSIERKAQEAYLAYRLEQEYSKDDILEMYLNKIYYSDGIYGIRTASLYYFNKELDELNLAEAAYLAGLPQLPNVYNLYEDNERGINRSHTVLSLMLQHGRITEAQYNEAINTDVRTNLVARSAEERSNESAENQLYAAYVNMIKEEIANNDNFRNIELAETLSSGIDIYTNMDSSAQARVQQIANNRQYFNNEKLASDDFNLATVVLDTKTGALKAISGGRDYQEVIKNNQALVERNAGSTMKPFLSYGPAIEFLNYRTDQLIQDEQSYTPIGHSNTIYNYDMQGHGQITMREALRTSYNIPAVKTFERVKEEKGEDDIVDFAQKVGLDYTTKQDGDYALSFNDVLGGSASTFSPLQMAKAYATLGNNGEYNEAHAIRYVVKSDGETVEFENESRQAIEPSTAYMLTDMLKDTFLPYGSADYIYMDGLNVAGKTGTTSYSRSDRETYNLPDGSAKDAWIVAYTPEYTISVWTGFTSTRSNGETSLVGKYEHITPQWVLKDMMESISSYNGEDFERPDDVVDVGNNELAKRGFFNFFSGNNSNQNSNANTHQNNNQNSSQNTWSWSWSDDTSNEETESEMTESNETNEEEPNDSANNDTDLPEDIETGDQNTESDETNSTEEETNSNVSDSNTSDESTSSTQNQNTPQSQNNRGNNTQNQNTPQSQNNSGNDTQSQNSRAEQNPSSDDESDEDDDELDD